MNEPPETLADVKAGDEVILFAGRNSYERCRVERITATQIILPGNRRFVRKSETSWKIGRLIGGSYMISGHISVGLSATKRIEEVESAQARTVAKNIWYKDAKHRFDADGVRRTRAACDRAEAALRELGEWTEPVTAENADAKT